MIVLDKNDIPYLPFATLGEYLRRVRSRHLLLGSLLDFDRPGTDEALATLASTTTEFDSDDAGRGDMYRAAQADASVRWTGMRQLLRLAVPARRGRNVVLDVLGGNGTIARAVRGEGDADLRDLAVLTGDLSGRMVENALTHGHAAVRQAADFMFLKPNAVDAVLFAYGTHHIAPAHRPLAVAEAVRVVRPGGRIVLHDFAEESPMAGFFAEVVNRYANSGHEYSHFSRASMTRLFGDAGLQASIADLYDPLIVKAGDPGEARRRMCSYVAHMYGVGAWFAAHENLDDSWRELTRRFDHSRHPMPQRRDVDVPMKPVVRRQGTSFAAIVPRIALIATAEP